MDQNSGSHLPDLDTRMLSDFIYELNIARRHLNTYPPGHPMIAAASDKVIRLLRSLFEFRPEIGFGVARDTLMFEGDWLDRKNPVYRDFAAFLFDRGIAAIHFSREIDREELIRLNQLLRAGHEEILAHGGYPELLETRQILHVKIVPVDYRSFSTTDQERIKRKDTADEEETEPLWENFLHALMEGALDPEGSRVYMPPDFDPSLVAGILNRKAEGHGMTGKENYDAVISAFISQTAGGGAGVTGAGLTPATRSEELGELIQQLRPEIRRQFLNSTFRTLENHAGKAREVLEAFPSDLIVDCLTQINQRNLQVSNNILNLLGKLSKHQGNAPARSAIGGDKKLDALETNERIRLIFREEDAGKFIPDAYQNALQTIVSTDQLNLRDNEESEYLRAILASQSIERQTSAIIFELMGQGAESALENTLQRNLVDLGRFFLETGDFLSLKDLHHRWLDHLDQDSLSTIFLDEQVLNSLYSEEFVDETLDALDRYGQEKQEEIRDYILSVGAPFAEALIQRLAEIENMSTRRFCMDCLTAMGHNAYEAIFKYVDDERWFLVRNLVIVLSRMQDASIMKRLYPLIDYPHPRVRQEVLKLMFLYNRPRAERQILGELHSDDIQTQIHAVQLADRSHNPEVRKILMRLLNQNALNPSILELKIQILKTLAQSGEKGTVRILEKLFDSGNILHPKLSKRLRLEIVKTLVSYPPDVAIPFLAKIVKTAPKDLATLAADQLRSLRGKSA